MNVPNNPDLERKLQELEAQVNEQSAQGQTASSEQNTFNSTVGEANEPSHQPKDDSLASLLSNFDFNQLLEVSKDWFNRLPQTGKVLVALVGAFVAISLLTSVLRLITSLITIGIVGVAVYLVYRFFFSSSD
ncbi:hypothetical protein [Spirulina sp. CS-785/01]|uniref:hypothetical protein n=1 Tax=Spirulina sp. CS-785/01 TaxID=3021716 RepID=UPI00232D4884|nr:hypothetical protein [Spirulina sp. CS-785/01]